MWQQIIVNGGEVVAGVPVESWLLGAYLNGFSYLPFPEVVLPCYNLNIINLDLMIVVDGMFSNCRERGLERMATKIGCTKHQRRRKTRNHPTLLNKATKLAWHFHTSRAYQKNSPTSTVTTGSVCIMSRSIPSDQFLYIPKIRLWTLINVVLFINLAVPNARTHTWMKPVDLLAPDLKNILFFCTFPTNPVKVLGLLDIFSESVDCSKRHLDLFQRCDDSLLVTWPPIMEWSCDSRSS